MNPNPAQWLVRRSSRIMLCSHAKTDTERFARLFAQVWRTIPAADRRRMRRGHRVVGDVWMLAHLVHDHPRLRHGPTGDAAAQFSPGPPPELIFCNDWFARLPDQHARCFIAHELGHCLLSATDPGHMTMPYDWAEEDVKEQIRLWGFDDDARIDFEHASGMRTEEAA